MTKILANTPASIAAAMALACVFMTGCEPRVKVEAPDKPVRIDLNVKIEHEVRIKVEKEVDQLIKKNPNLF